MGRELQQLLLTLAAGLASGFVVSVPVGPVNLTVINQALRRGFVAAFLVGLGAIIGESVYATFALVGHSSLLDQPAVLRVLRVVAVGILVGLGVRYLLFRPEKLQASEAVAVRVDERWHHPRSFLLGFVMTVSNLMLFLLWATLGALLLEREWVRPDVLSRAVCVAGVLAGGAAWFFLLAFFVSRAHRRVRPRTLTMLVRSCGAVLLLFGLWLVTEFFRGQT